MVYFSKLRSRRVVTESGVHVGKIYDCVFTFTELAHLTKLVVTVPHDKEPLYISMDDITLFGDEIVVVDTYSKETIEENELYIGRNLLDKQIIDIEGKKVVRVNDVMMQLLGDKKLYIAGVDIGVMGILRWMYLDKAFPPLVRFLGIRLREHMLSWKNIQPLELSEGKVVIDSVQEKLERFLPEDLADYLESTNIRNAIKTLDLVDTEFASEVIAELNLNFQIALFEELGFKRTVGIIGLMDPDEAVDVLLQFDVDKRAKILSALEGDTRTELERLISVARTSVGQYMTTEYLTIRRTDTVAKALTRVQNESRDFDFLFYLYVVNEENELIGVCNIHQLLLHKPHTSISTVMHSNVVLAHLHTPIKVVAKRMISYKLYGLPVVDTSRKMIGVVLLDDIDEALLGDIL